MVCQWKVLNDSGVLYIIRKVIKRRLRWYHFLKTLAKTIIIWNLKHGICHWKLYKNDNMLYMVEKVLEMLLKGNIFENVDENMWTQN